MKAKELTLQAEVNRKRLVEIVYNGGAGHIGGDLSCLNVMTALYFDIMNTDPKNPKMPERDRFVLSKGHCTPALYPTLALRGYFPVEELELFRSIKGHMSGHPDMKHIPGVDMSSGSLGQGISCAVGMALAAKLDNASRRVYTILGDGESEEGQVWEACMSAAHYKLDNLCVIVDNNGLQIDGEVTKVMNPHPIDAKLEAFGFDVQCIDGHDFDQIEKAMEHAKTVSGKPSAIIMTTVKGKDVSFMENNAGWHGVAPNDAQYEQAMAELNNKLAELEGM